MLAVFCTVFNAYMVDLIESALLYIPIGIMGIAWLFSLSFILLKKFKVPIAIDDAQNVLDEQKRAEKVLKKQNKMKIKMNNSKKSKNAKN